MGVVAVLIVAVLIVIGWAYLIRRKPQAFMMMINSPSVFIAPCPECGRDVVYAPNMVNSCQCVPKA